MTKGSPQLGKGIDTDSIVPEPEGIAENVSEKWEQIVNLESADGEPIGRLDMDFDDEIIESNGFRYKRLKGITIVPSGGGEPINILADFKVNISQINILIPGRYTGKSNLYRRSNVVMGKPIENHFDLLVLMHEIGHAEQDKDPYWSKVHQMNDNIKSGWVSVDLDFIKWLFETFPESREILESDPAFVEYLRQLKNINEKLEKVWDSPENISQSNKLLHTITSRFNEIISRFFKPSLSKDDIKKRTAYQGLLQEKTTLNATINTTDILYIPTIVLEWDANKRVFSCAEALQQKGVNLLLPCKIDTDEDLGVKNPEKEMERAVTYWIPNYSKRGISCPQNIRDIIEIYRK